MKLMKSRRVDIEVVDEALTWVWDSKVSPIEMTEKIRRLMEEVEKRLEKDKGTPIFFGSSTHAHFDCFCIDLVEITNDEHPLYSEAKYPALHKFVGPELVVKMERPQGAQIGWPEIGMEEFVGKGPIVYPHQEDTAWKYYVGYVVLASLKFCDHTAFLVIGGKDCLAQLKVWGIEKKELKCLF